MLLFLWLACGEVLLTRSPPPTALAIESAQLLDGWGARIVVTAEPGATVNLVAGRAGRQTCPAALNGTCLDVGGAVFLGSSSTNPAGMAVFTHTLPSTLQVGAPVAFQAVRLGPSSAHSAVLQTTVDAWNPALADSDGLDPTEEFTHGTDPYSADSDDGGLPDLREIRLGLDPHDALDDRTVETDCIDGHDDDSDGLEDCDDPDCQCREIDCQDGIDDDHDGLVDCEDESCLADPSCQELSCDDGVDNDDDGLTDCDDDDCWSADCQDSTLAFVTSSSALLLDVGGPLEALGTLRGEVYVDGPTGPHFCDWAWTFGRWHSPSDDNALFLAPGCQVDRAVLPDIQDLALVGNALMSTRYQVPLLTASWEQLTWTTYSYGTRTYRLPEFQADATTPGQPIGTCSGGVDPIQRYRDRDGDGYGLSSATDRWGVASGPVWVCSASAPGTTDVGGDCDDLDPSWSPGSIRLAPGAGCTDVQPNDRDADGTPDALDPHPDDGALP